jgi:hypothetical protein
MNMCNYLYRHVGKAYHAEGPCLVSLTMLLLSLTCTSYKIQLSQSPLTHGRESLRLTLRDLTTIRSTGERRRMQMIFQREKKQCFAASGDGR